MMMMMMRVWLRFVVVVPCPFLDVYIVDYGLMLIADERKK